MITVALPVRKISSLPQGTPKAPNSSTSPRMNMPSKIGCLRVAPFFLRAATAGEAPRGGGRN